MLEVVRRETPSHIVMRQRCDALAELLPSLAASKEIPTILTAILENARVQGGGGKKAWASEENYNALRDAAAKLADDLGPGSVQDLDDESRIARLDKQVEATGWRSLRSDGASGVEVAIVAEEFGRRLVDTPFLGPVLADDLARHFGADARGASLAVDDRVIDARGCRRALFLSAGTVLAAPVCSTK